MGHYFFKRCCSGHLKAQEVIMTAQELRQKYLAFFKAKGHQVIPSASLIPENDPTVLFTTAGMHPLVPYLLGEKHPAGARLTNFQKCLRTDDIDEVGDRWHLTFFEMLGNWSIGYQSDRSDKTDGPYWKREAIEWSWEFLTGEKWLGLEPQKIYISIFGGDPAPTSRRGGASVPADEESIKIWQEVFNRAGIEATVGEGGLSSRAGEASRIGLYGRKENWWGPVGQTGPCGPDTEMFYDTGQEHDPKFGPVCHQNCPCGRFAEIWNDVFMQYAKTFDGDYIEMTYKNIDTGLGLERVLAVLNGEQSVFETELFLPLIHKIEELSAKNYTQDLETTRAMRIMADHLRAATFILGDEKGVSPSNVEQGYILRRLIRRAIRFGYQLGIKSGLSVSLARLVVANHGEFYPELAKNQERIYEELQREEERFSQTLSRSLKKIEVMVRQIHRLENILTQFKDGDIDDDNDRQFVQSILKEPWLVGRDFLRRILESRDLSEIKNLVDEFARYFKISGQFIFDLYTQDGFPPEMVGEVMATVEKPTVKYPMMTLSLELDLASFQEKFKEHQALSRAGAEQKFKGGLVDQSEISRRMHTATHLLLAALRQVLGPEVYQKGSNITPERIRFDFNWPRKLTGEELKQVEELVNQKISEDIPVEMVEMPKDEALRSVKVSFDPAKYGEVVKVYRIADFSVELCGGPHVSRTGEMGRFKIIKEEASSAGVRRIRAVLE